MVSIWFNTICGFNHSLGILKYPLFRSGGLLYGLGRRAWTSQFCHKLLWHGRIRPGEAWIGFHTTSGSYSAASSVTSRVTVLKDPHLSWWEQEGGIPASGKQCQQSHHLVTQPDHARQALERGMALPKAYVVVQQEKAHLVKDSGTIMLGSSMWSW